MTTRKKPPARDLKKVILLISVVVVVAAAGVSSIILSHAATSGALYVDGNIIRQDANTRFIFKGYNVYMLPWYTDGAFKAACDQQYNDRDAIFAKMQSLGMNVVRIPYGGNAWSNNGPYYNQATITTRMDSIVASAKSHGIRVYVEDHDFTGMNDSVYTAGTYTSMYPFMDAMINHFKNEPYFMMEDFNEPGGMSWPNWVKLQEAVLLHARKTDGYTGLFMMDGISWGETADPASFQAVEAYDATLLGGKGNTMFAEHHYPLSASDSGFPGAWASSWGVASKTVPAFLEEFGLHGGGGYYQQGIVNDLPTWTNAINSGWNGGVSWIWNWIDGNGNADTNRNFTSLGSAMYDGFLAKYSGTVASDGSSPTPPPTPPTATKVTVPFRMRSGGPAYTDPSGNAWTTDGLYSTDGSTNTQGAGKITGTTNPSLYEDERWANPHLGYAIPVANGTYTLNLHFAEINATITSAGKRVFSGTAEGKPLFSNLDIYSEVGGFKPDDKSYQVTVTDGELDLSLDSTTDAAKLAGLEILPAGTATVVAPTISSVSPTTGTTAGGTQVTITGTHFVSGATVSFAGTAATSVSVNSNTSITATVPAHAAGSADIIVTNADNGTATATRAFTYTAPTTPTTLTADINNDGHVNTLDLSIVLTHDGQNYGPADLNGDGTVGAADLAILLSHWLW